VVLYAARACEVDASAIELAATAANVPTYYPRVEAGGLTFRRARLDQLVPGRFGVLEPLEDAERLDAAARRVVVVVPGLAFDRQGNRLGTGQGYYDRALPSLEDARRIGLTLEALLVGAIPVDPWDVPMHAIASERGIFPADHRVGVDPGDHPWT
jgi:5-formyltetrahydrofolate cyclo-ligase